MIGYSRGDIVLVPFLYTDESAMKVRPALVLSSGPYHASRQELIVAAVTSNISRKLVGDHVLSDWQGAGLALPSVVTGILRTIKRTTVRRRLGSIRPADRAEVDRQLRQSLDL